MFNNKTFVLRAGLAALGFSLCLGPAMGAEIRRTPAVSDDPDQIANWQAPVYYQPAATQEDDSSGRMQAEAERSNATQLDVISPATSTPKFGLPAVLVAVTPCRLVDTRSGSYPFGAPSMTAGSTRVIPAPGRCGLPTGAVAYSFNVGVIPLSGGPETLTAWPDGQPRPNIATVTAYGIISGATTTNAAVVAAGANGAFDIYTTARVNVTIDVNGYYVAAADRNSDTMLGTGTLQNNSGGDNTAVGYLALQSNTTGNFNSASGALALASNTSGGSNTASGYQALYANTTGGANTAFGDVALVYNTTGSGNTATGAYALSYNTTGCCNTADGAAALWANTTGSGNSAMGSGALYFNTTGGENAAVGDNALNGNTTGGNNTAIGAFALKLNTTGSSNTASGNVALYSNTTGNNNTATGAGALHDNTTGQSLTAVGSGALGHNTTAANNTAIGSGALGANTTGGDNAATGAWALTANTTGVDNTATGIGSLGQSTTGGANTADGENALNQSKTGWGNTAVGYAALWGLTSGDNNTAIGIQAGTSLTTGSYNVFVANQGNASDDHLIRIGDVQTSTFIAGIRGATTGNADAIAVVIDSNGQLGTVSSSRRVKRDIADMGDTSETLMSLRPVQFRYTAHGADSPLQYGLIAEEVAEVAPDLVARKTNGEVETVFYDKVNAMLLNEVQKQQRTIEGLKSQNETLAETLRRVEARLAALEQTSAR